MYALVEIKGKQYKAEKGAVLKVDKFDKQSGDKVEFDSVLLISGEGDPIVGSPYVDGAKVTAVVKSNVKDPKVKVFKFKRRKGYRRTQGHRQNYTLLTVEDILGA
ncbi:MULTISPECIES: 50S ribosomal protein L21 [unclassified Oceanispirochaeta]|uniref:50S ribosomal protein L21 n=1 Tax=unclassified Oceanispirochaeta TaxID=2635722 RepID=UPI000E092E27|nr:MULTISPECIES: 50S ribosomal protein L21 [unclassified Oceanispirochaeta]MBF9018088.1 50S ribosomal protein L21 [Oceanispirochaeta sp. M2]NPD74552.1 50S ribosomal protein L21 [Oceanispirochaeta sp. M1]RDG29583.1 50S ribosomal protein L21 [Oceanispirochaeta sp. M1]